MKRGKLLFIDRTGEKLYFGDGDKVTADIEVKNDTFYKQVVLFGDIGFGESYMSGYWETSDLTKVISFFISNMDYLPSMSGARKAFSPINFLKTFNKFQHYFKPNNLKGSQKNISAHYDLNNDFFKLFLDPTMTYSSGYFKETEDTLEQAQKNKYQSLCEAIKLNENNHILEIGCGWGGFAIYAATAFGCKVTGITISKEQFKYATDKVKTLGLEKQISIVFEDYRKVKGKFDKVVSIEMIEAVGHKYFKAYFKQIDNLLTEEGVLGLQAIVIPDQRYDEYRKSIDWLQKHIFPGGLLPSIAKINESVNKTGNMNLYSLKEMGFSYANTLRHWLSNFEQNLSDVSALGFDEMFIRKWEYYLCSCEASFKERNINVVQMVYARPNNSSF